MPPHKKKPTPKDELFERGRQLLQDAENSANPEFAKLRAKAAKRYFDADLKGGSEMSTNPTGFSGLNPFEILKLAIKAVPAVKYALAVGGIVAVIVIVAGWKIDFRIAVFGVVIMLVLMTAVVLFAHLAKESASVFRAPAVVFMWFSVILTMASALAVFLSVFVGWPADWRGLVSAQKVVIEPGQASLIPPLVKVGAPVGSRFQYSYKKENPLECLSEYVKVSATEWYEQASPESPAGCKVGAIAIKYTERESNSSQYILLYDEGRNLFARLNNTDKGQFSPTEWRLVSNPAWSAGRSVTRIN
jgi:hypothetical protein